MSRAGYIRFDWKLNEVNCANSLRASRLRHWILSNHFTRYDV